MTLRAIPASMDPAVVGTIDADLDRIEREHDVTVLLAVESGSRAWGFPSPDSDYDCRFVYVARPEIYLSPWSTRDVIETPLTEVFDVNGWDLAKALRLLVKGNAVIVEWLMSPIVYRGEPEFRRRFRELAAEIADRDRIARHYRHLGERQWRRLGEGEVSLKKLFYSLRPAMALRWLHEHPRAAVPPMHLPTLMEQCELTPELRSAVAELTDRKSATREMGAGPVPSSVAEFVVAEFERATTRHPERPGDPERARTAADRFFRECGLAAQSAIRSSGAACPDGSVRLRMCVASADGTPRSGSRRLG